MAKTLLLIHGRSFKPDAADLRSLWYGAIRHGIKRDRPRKIEAYNKVKKEFVYYGDISNRFLKSGGKTYNKVNDLDSRKETYKKLKTYNKEGFSKANYNDLPGQNALKEFLADVGSPLFSFIGLTEGLIAAVAPDMREYWDSREFGSAIRQRMSAPLMRAMNRGDQIMVVSHSLGTIASWDTFWKFSRTGEYRLEFASKKIHRWITLGSPLGDSTVKRKLKGHDERGEFKYPSNVVRWDNVAAEDDFIAHDEDVANDFRNMEDRYGLVKLIRDHEIYNLAVRSGTSNPHHGVGYLMHPKVTKLIADWV